MNSVIAGTGSYLPAHVIGNDDLTQFPPQVRPLIFQKTGIRARRHAAPEESTSDLAIAAARDCLAKAGVAAAEVDGIILATSSPDRIQPATATRVQSQIGAARAFAFDLNSVCSGAVYAIAVADGLIRSGQCRTVLVVAAEIYSRFLNPADFSTYPYFGDGAGALLLTAGEGPRGIVRTVLHADGAGCDVIQVPAGGTMRGVAQAEERDRYFTMRGREVFEFALQRGSEAIEEVLAAAGVDRGDVRWVVSHQANARILEALADRVGIERARFAANLETVGNTAAASVPIALDELNSAGRIADGDLVVLVAFGGGLSWAASLVRW